MNLRRNITITALLLAAATVQAGTLVVRNVDTGGGEYANIQAAIDALPNPFDADYTIEVVDTGVAYDHVAVSNTPSNWDNVIISNTTAQAVIDFAAYRLNIVGVDGRPTIAITSPPGIAVHGINLLNHPVTVSNFRFTRTVEFQNPGGSQAYIRNVGSAVLVSDIVFEPLVAVGGSANTDRYPAILFRTGTGGQAGTIIERCYFDGIGSATFALGNHDTFGGTHTDPLVLRNNIIARCVGLFVGISFGRSASYGAVRLPHQQHGQQRQRLRAASNDRDHRSRQL